jgi:hypothetical protein
VRDEETSVHIVLEASLRHAYLGFSFLEPEVI